MAIGAIRALCCTSSPPRASICPSVASSSRRLPRCANQPDRAHPYRQMAGRAGRHGLEKLGESFLLVDDARSCERMRAAMTAEVPQLVPSLTALSKPWPGPDPGLDSTLALALARPWPWPGPGPDPEPGARGSLPPRRPRRARATQTERPDRRPPAAAPIAAAATTSATSAAASSFNGGRESVGACAPTLRCCSSSASRLATRCPDAALMLTPTPTHTCPEHLRCVSAGLVTRERDLRLWTQRSGRMTRDESHRVSPPKRTSSHEPAP